MVPAAMTDTITGDTSVKLEAGEYVQPSGRFPANVILDEEAGKLLDVQSGISKSPTKVTRGGNRQQAFGMGVQTDVPCFGDSGGASRFFLLCKGVEEGAA